MRKVSKYIALAKSKSSWTVVVAQLVEQSLPTAEILGSNPVIVKIYIECLLSAVLKRKKVKKKEAGNGPFFKKTV